MKVVLTLWNDLIKTYEADAVEEDFTTHKFYVLKGEQRIAGYWLKHVFSWEIVEDKLVT